MAPSKLKKNRINERGFTLVELIVVVAVLGIVSSLVYNMISESTKQYRTLQSSNVSRQEAQLSMDFIVSEIRRNDKQHMIFIDQQNNYLKMMRYDDQFQYLDELAIVFEDHEIYYQIDHHEKKAFSIGKRIKNLSYNVIYNRSEEKNGYRNDIKSIEVVIDYYVDDNRTRSEQLKTLVVLRSFND